MVCVTFALHSPTDNDLLSPGVYCIRNLLSGKVYVGSATKAFLQRFKGHRTCLRVGRHSNSYLQRAWDKYGSEAFVFETLEACAPEMCVVREQWWMDYLRATDGQHGYNLSPTAGNTLGVKHTAAARENMSKAHRGKPLSAEHRENMVESIRQTYARVEVRERSAKVNRERMAAETPEAKAIRCKGRRHTDEQRARLSELHTGMTHTAETRAKISAAQRGKKLSAEHRAKIREGNLGRVWTEESKAKLRKTKRERCADPAFKARMSEIVRLRHEEEKKMGIKRKCRVFLDV